MPTDPPAGRTDRHDPNAPNAEAAAGEAASPADMAPPTEVESERPALARLISSAEPVVGRVTSAVESAVSGAIEAAGRAWTERPGARVRRVRRLARFPLPSLYQEHPEARRANPRELGLRTLELDEIAGTAVGGATQRGGDFLPLRPFRSTNWSARWQRIRSAVDQLKILPPIDVVKYRDRYWVLDGHNRVAAALYSGQVGIDANVTELVPPGQNPSERPANLAAALGGSRAVRAAGQGTKPTDAVLLDDAIGLPRPGGPGPGDEPEGDRAGDEDAGEPAP